MFVLEGLISECNLNFPFFIDFIRLPLLFFFWGQLEVSLLIAPKTFPFIGRNSWVVEMKWSSAVNTPIIVYLSIKLDPEIVFPMMTDCATGKRNSPSIGAKTGQIYIFLPPIIIIK